MWLVRDAVSEGKLGPSDIDESLKDAAELALRDMTEAGYDIVSDGEMLRADFTRNFHGRIDGLEPIDYERRLGYPGPDQLDAFSAVREVSVPDGYGLVPEVEHLLARTRLPFVTALQGPVTQAFRIDPSPAYADKGKLAWALVPFINAELKAAVTAGATLIQLDEPAFWIMPGGLPEMVDITNACLEGVAAMTSLHLCFGNFRGRPATSYRSYAAFGEFFDGLTTGCPQPGVRQPVDVGDRAVGGAWRRQGAGGGRHRCQGARPRDTRDRRRSHPAVARSPWHPTSCGCQPTVVTARRRAVWPWTRCDPS